MMRPLNERVLVSFLRREGFVETNGREHRTFRRGHFLVQWRKLDGRQTMLVIWSIEQAGYDRKYIKRELGLLAA
jgi:hypothetical protein